MNEIWLLSIVFGGFLVFGLSENVKGPAIPRMQLDFGLNEGQLGLMLALNSLGYLVACSFTSFLADRVGIKATSIAAFVSMAAGGVLIGISNGFQALTASYFFMYIGNGMLEIALAILAARIFVKNTGFLMNLAHFFYGLSSIVAPIAAASMMGWRLPGGDAALGWRGMYVIVLMLSLLPVIPALLGRLPVEPAHDEAEERISYSKLMRDPVAWLIVLVLTSGVISELSIGSWLANFLEKAYDWSPTDASGMLSAFFLCFTLARLLIGPLTDRFGYTLSIMVLSLSSGICSIAALFAGESGAMLFALAGVGIAPIYPTVMALLAKRYPRGTGTAITFTVTLMGIGSVLGNLAIGGLIEGVRNLYAGRGERASQVLGLQAGYGFIGAMALLCTAACLVLYFYLRKRGERY
ncbi:MFS transporter [Cohnella hashimotonis]|uniref:MFS transporter n=1 Tax=Cohnella hashimotonis TaxID=2826895 RepID=A0ABT6TAN1_9BACL|nr:MFS transporter [Cohnella hashimotonis]MDI4643892.1 MFS transporter [Cohnella hashimotonis]